MVNSSPEYSITKPGLHHLRKRDKPLRTYGRQTSTPEAQNEPPVKKRRVAALEEKQEKPISSSHTTDTATRPEDAVVTTASETNTKQDAASQGKPNTHAQSAKKGSILSYFKPAAQKPKEDDTPSPSQDSQPEEPTAPQETPKKKHSSKRKPRLLKIKATTHEPSSQESNTPLEQDSTRNPSNTTETTSSSTSPASSPGRRKPGRNSMKPLSKTRSPSIQTTLNISAQAPFSECKICDTVWNPLYPDDVKFHNKTHRAVLRAQKRKVDDL